MPMISRTVLCSAALLSLATIPLGAADMVVSDLRLGFGVLSTDYRGASSTTVSSGSDTISSTSSSGNGRDADNNLRLQLQYVAGTLGAGGGLIWGVGIAANHATWDNGSQDAHVTTPSVEVLIGYGYAITSAWHVELTPFVGAGRAYYSVSDHGSADTNENWDAYIEYGAKLGTYAALGQGLVLGIEVPYLVGRFEPEYDYVDGADNTVTVSDTRRNHGLGLVASIGMRF
jgi:hypothetical protein